MLHTKIELDVDYAAAGISAPETPANLVTYILSRDDDQWVKFQYRSLPAVIVCGGGGYEYVANVEREPIALRFNGAGFHAFVLNYSVAPNRFPASLLELSKAVALVREHAEEWNIDPNRIAVVGFSAGGHLAGSLGVYWHEDFVQKPLGFTGEENKPNALILSYAVLSNKENVTHLYSAKMLLGEELPEKEFALFALEDHVSEKTPPTFLWTSCDDMVPSMNSLLFATELAKRKIRYEMHIYAHALHSSGLGTIPTASNPANVNPDIQDWIERAVRFVENCNKTEEDYRRETKELIEKEANRKK